MSAANQRIDAPAEVELAPFRCCAATLASSQESAHALGQAGAEMMSSVFALWSQQMQIGLAWAQAAGEALASGLRQAQGQAWRGSEHHLKEDDMRVSECMTREVELAGPNDTIAEAAKRMARLDAGVLPVRDNDRLVGMITDRDIAVRGVGQGRGPDTRVGDVMNAEVKYCYDDEEVGEVLKKMGELQLRRMPVLNHDKRLVGIISLGDLAASSETKQAGDALCDISRPGGQHSQTAH
jgi:CBS domain-containing protein